MNCHIIGLKGFLQTGLEINSIHDEIDGFGTLGGEINVVLVLWWSQSHGG